MGALVRGAVEALGTLGLAAVLGAAGLALIAGALMAAARGRPDRLDGIARVPRGGAEGERLRAREEVTGPLSRFAAHLQPSDEAELGAMRMRLLRAGYRRPDAVLVFHAAQMGLALGGLALGLGYVLGSGAPMTTPWLVGGTLGPMLAGYLAPRRIVASRLKARREEVETGFPDALDLMLVCVEAGQSLDQSVVRVARELAPAYPALAAEFEVVAQETKAGKDRARVLRDMAERTGLQDVSSFVTVLIQSQSFGTSVAEALRLYAGEMRDKRVVRAEERANTLPTKMTLATMTLTVPPLMMILVGPSVIGILQSFGGLR